MTKKIFVLSCAFVIFFITSGCQWLNKKEHTLTLTESQEPPSLDSAKSVDMVSFKVLNNTMEGLLRSGKDGTIVLGMAEKMPLISKDRKTYTFTLRRALWSDGKPVTAHDFVFAWKRVLSPETTSEFSYLLFPIRNAENYNTKKKQCGKR